MLIESQATNGTKGKSILTNPTHLWCLSDISSSYVPTMQWYRQGYKWRSNPQQQWQLRPPNWLNKQTVQELHNLRSKRFRTELFRILTALKKAKIRRSKGGGARKGTLARKLLDFEKPIFPWTELLIGVVWSSWLTNVSTLLEWYQEYCVTCTLSWRKVCVIVLALGKFSLDVEGTFAIFLKRHHLLEDKYCGSITAEFTKAFKNLSAAVLTIVHVRRSKRNQGRRANLW